MAFIGAFCEELRSIMEVLGYGIVKSKRLQNERDLSLIW